MAHETAVPATDRDHIHRLAVRYLEAQAAAPGAAAHPGDPGIPVLAHLTGDDRATPAAVAAWARTAGRGPAHPALHDGGLAGTLVGLRLGAHTHPALRTAADRLAAHFGGRLPAYRTRDVAFPDYDLISGPAGTLLALCAIDPAPELLRPLTSHLTLLCDDPELPRLRTGQYERHPYLSWVHGRVNTGMGHGVAGVVTALTAVLRRTGPDGAVAAALARATRWLADRAYTDDRGIRTWPAAGTDHPPETTAQPRQAWCYGAPGVAWALWDAADALGDTAAADRAAADFTALAERYDTSFHLFGDTPGDRLGLCHGAAGVLAVADAFDRHARLPAAAGLKARLIRHLTDGIPAEPPTDWPADLLNGSPGALAALLTATSTTAPRTWLHCLGLR
ncbi:lanthionine synthetase LanC family protein [Streptomyces sp. RFCAC02]|uniref:lanthionine synthetase LanC family protein n=1 Tax=Streptomyces sp. RFCAC02 TaxID=2499143 RepID=UPI00101ED2EB|nr:lanthionine synthetase LanC family protein [Streptomyces sp. RFCAC02]